MEIKKLNLLHKKEIEEILNLREKSAKVIKEESLNENLLETFIECLRFDYKGNVFGYYIEDKLHSVILNIKLQGQNSWYMAYVTSRPSSLWMNKNGIFKLMEHSVKYMEDNGYHQFYYARPLSYRISKYRMKSDILSRYDLFIEEIVPKGKSSKYHLFSSNIFNNRVAKTDIVIVNWVLRQEYRKYPNCDEYMETVIKTWEVGNS